MAADLIPLTPQTRRRALTIAATAFLLELLISLAGGKAILDSGPAHVLAPLLAMLIPLGITWVVLGASALIPGVYDRKLLSAGAVIYVVVAIAFGLLVAGFSDTDGAKLFSARDAIVYGLAWPLAPFAAMLQAMRDGLGWYT